MISAELEVDWAMISWRVAFLRCLQVGFIEGTMAWRGMDVLAVKCVTLRASHAMELIYYLINAINIEMFRLRSRGGKISSRNVSSRHFLNCFSSRL